eukprot:3167512-Prymnesium_polylepis.1
MSLDGFPSSASLETARSRVGGVRCVLENVENDANRAAILRSVEALGLLHVHEVQADEVQPARPAKQQQSKHGKAQRTRARDDDCARWLVLHRHGCVDDCVSALSTDGFTLCAAVAPIDNAMSSGGDVFGDEARAARRGVSVVELGELDFSRKLALVFGNERLGVTEEMRLACDICFTIPMRGLSESLNVSVATAIALHWGRVARLKSLQRQQQELGPSGSANTEVSGDLSEAEVLELEAWYRRVAEVA